MGPLIRANLTAMLFIAAFVAFQFVAVLYLQELRGWSALETGLALLVVGLDAFLAPTLTPRLVNRYGTQPVIVAGMVAAAGAYALWLPVGPDWAYATMLPALTLLGVAFSLAYGSLAIAATDGVAAEDQGVASGLLGTAIQFGAAVGLAAVAAVNVAATHPIRTPSALLDGYRAALAVPFLAAALGVAISAGWPASRRPTSGRHGRRRAGQPHRRPRFLSIGPRRSDIGQIWPQPPGLTGDRDDLS